MRGVLQGGARVEYWPDARAAAARRACGFSLVVPRSHRQRQKRRARQAQHVDRRGGHAVTSASLPWLVITVRMTFEIPNHFRRTRRSPETFLRFCHSRFLRGHALSGA